MGLPTKVVLTLACTVFLLKIESSFGVPLINQSKFDPQPLQQSLVKDSDKSNDGIIRFPGKVTKKCRPSETCKVSEELDYVCGSDKKTYKNMDEFECFRTSCNKDLTVENKGRCQSISVTEKAPEVKEKEVREKKYLVPVPELVIQNQLPKTCNPDECGCGDEFNPICGSDGITYGNKCLLECNRKCNPEVIVFHDGYCGRLFFRNGQNGQFQQSVFRQHQFVQSNLV